MSEQDHKVATVKGFSCRRPARGTVVLGSPTCVTAGMPRR
jgi:hypothetical protein